MGRNFAIVLAFFLAACGITPGSGPQSIEVPNAVDSLPYAYVKLTREASEVLARYTPRISTTFTDRRPPRDFQFGVGDIVSVTIFEAAAGGLFIPAEASVRPGNFITLPNQAVDNNGKDKNSCDSTLLRPTPISITPSSSAVRFPAGDPVR